MRIASLGSLNNLAQGVQRQFSTAERTAQESREGLRESLSELGKGMSTRSEKHQDIDDSDLPQAIRDLLKMIRELRAQIVEKQAQIEAVMSDQRLDAEGKRQQLEGLQTELASLNSALTAANAQLIKWMRDNGLSSEQMQAASLLAMS